MSVKKSRDLVFEIENASKSAQESQALILRPFNLTHGLAELSFQLGNRNITHSTKLWDGNYYMLLLSSYSKHLKTNAKILSLFLKYLIYFIKKYSFKR